MPNRAEECSREMLDTIPLIMCAIRAEMRRRRKPDLTVPQFRALAYLHHFPNASLSDVAENVGLMLPSMSKLMDGLVLRGFVSRREAAGDRRRIDLALTSAGHTVLELAYNAAQKHLAELLRQLDASQRAAIVRTMRVLRPIFTAAETSKN